MLFLHIMNWVYSDIIIWCICWFNWWWCHFEVLYFFKRLQVSPKESPYWHTFFCIFFSIQCGKQLWSNFCDKGARKTNFGDDPTSRFTTSRPWQFVDCLTCKYIYILTLHCGLKQKKVPIQSSCTICLKWGLN